MNRPRSRVARVLAAVLATGVLATVLGACASAGSSASADSRYGDITVQLSWLKNHEFSGYFDADAKHYFTDAGFGKVDFTAGGQGGVSAATALASGKAWAGIAGVADVAQANAEGADLRVVALTYQKNPFTLVSADAKPIRTPQDLVGKTIAIADASALNWEAFLKANNIPPDSVHRVPYGDAQNDLRLGQIDGFMGYGDGGAPLRATGFGAQEFLLADYGLSYSAEAVVVTADTLRNEPDKVEAFLTAYARGWKSAYDDPQAAIDRVINDYGRDQKWDRDEITVSWGQQEKLVLTDESRTHGIGTISQDLIQRNLSALQLVGLPTTADAIFAPDLIAKVYGNQPDLVLGTR